MINKGGCLVILLALLQISSIIITVLHIQNVIDMKKNLLILSGIIFFTCAVAQEYVAPTKNFFRSRVTINFLAQFRMEEDGMYHYYETKGIDFLSSERTKYSEAVEGVEHFYCYDKSNNIFYYYTENTIGFYNPRHSNYIKLVKSYMKQGNVKKVKETEAMLLTENILKGMQEKYRLKNDSILESKRIAREKFIEDSIEAAQRKAKEYEEYRKKHDWRDLTMSRTYGLKCEFCDEYHYLKNYRVMLLNADTLYYFLEKPDITYLGINHVDIHYSTLTWDFKNDSKFKEYVNIWHDSIDNNNNFSKQDAALFNLIQYNEFRDKVSSTAPSGFLQRWGWKLNSAQGIEPFFTFFNSSKKTIKYVDFYFSMFNAVGDRCYLKYERSYIGNVRGVGPVEPFESGSWNWDRATHYTSGDAYEMRIVKLVITYMDRTTKTIPNSSIIYDNYK